MDHPPPGSSDKQELLSAFDQVVTREQERKTATPLSPPRRPMQGGLVVAGALSYLFLAYMWIGKPDWLFAPDAAPPPLNVEAALRMELYLHGSALNDHLATTGQLPSTLEEVSTPESAVEYQRMGDSAWVLRGSEGAVSLTLHSTDPLERFLGTSVLDLTPPGAR